MTPPSSYKFAEFWKFLTGLHTPFDVKRAKAMFIKDIKYWLLHKVLAYVVFHKTEFNSLCTRVVFDVVHSQ